MTKFKKVYYHERYDKGSCYVWRTDDSIKQIKSDVSGNGCVLDAIFYEDTQSVTLYSNRYSKSDVLDANI